MTFQKYSLKNVILLLIVIVVAICMDINYSKRYHQSTPEMDEEIKDYRIDLTPELLSSYDICLKNLPDELDDLKLDQFVTALKKAKLGGYSHPVYFGHLIFTENKDGNHFEIDVKIGEEHVAVSICIYNNGKMLAGLPYHSEELINWAHDVGFI